MGADSVAIMTFVLRIRLFKELTIALSATEGETSASAVPGSLSRETLHVRLPMQTQDSLKLTHYTLGHPWLELDGQSK